MKLDAQTLIFMFSLALVTQVIALLVQYKMGHRISHGVRWWLLGTGLTALGVILMPLVTVESLLYLAMIANPLVVLGEIFLYIAILRFLGKKEKRWLLISIYIGFAISYYYYIFFSNDISSRTVVINVTLATVSFMAAHKLFSEKNKFISSSANFTAAIFLIYGVFSVVRIIWVGSNAPAQNYLDQALILNAGFIVPTVASTLWTFGFILMANQRLNMENLLEKEKMQLIFNTSPDAALITRLSDGLVVDVNVGFTALSGYTRDEVLGDTTLKISVWQNAEDRQLFLTELNDKGMCENLEFVFQRKDGSQIYGMISARIITIQDIPHIVSVVRDITERKQAEQHIQELLQQLEIEKNTAQLNSITDSLTGLVNRRYFDMALKTEFYRLKRSGSMLSLIMLDVDHFKNFNDTYGHLAGDDCLQHIGAMLKTVVGRAPDIVARFGGEEFAVILPETESPGVEDLAEKIRKGVEALAIPHAASDTADCVTVSLGVVSVSTTGLISPKEVIALADKALYRAKNNGRNRIIVVNDKTIHERLL